MDAYGVVEIAAAATGSGLSSVSITITQTFNGPVGQTDRVAAAELARSTLNDIDAGVGDLLRSQLLLLWKVIQT